MMFCLVACLIAFIIGLWSVPAGLAFLVAAALVDIIGSIEP